MLQVPANADRALRGHIAVADPGLSGRARTAWR